MPSARRSRSHPDEHTSPSPAADTDVLPGDAAGEGDGGDQDDEVQNPRLKELSDEASKWRRKFRQAEERIASLRSTAADEALRDENRTLRVQLAWVRATADANLVDADAAWTLAQDDLKAVEVNDGQVDGNRIGEIVNHVIKRYPYLVAEDEPAHPPAADAFPDTQPSGRRTEGKLRHTGSTVDLAALQRKFPALRGR